MLPHWPRRVGLGDPYADAQAILSGHGTVDLNGLQAAASLAPQQVVAQGQQVYGQLSGSVQAQWNSATSGAQNNARIGAGVSAASDLLSNGYNPDSADDNQKLIVAVAGAVSLIPGVGPILGGAVMILDAIGQGIAKVLEDVGLIWFGCRTTGNWTTASALNAMQGGPYRLPSIGGHDFASLAIPMLAANLTRVLNCQGALQNLQIVTAAAAMWNAGASGPPLTVYIPAMAISTSQVFTVSEQIPSAFQPAANTSDVGYFGNWSSESDGNPAFQSSFTQDVPATPPFILQLAGSTYTPPPPSPPSAPSGQQTQPPPSTSYHGMFQSSSGPITPSGMSTGSKVAAGAAIAGGATLLGSAAYAAYTHQSFTSLWAQLLRRAKFW